MIDHVPEPSASEQALLEDVVGYLNFSAGVGDPKFLQQLNALYRSFEADLPPTSSLPRLCAGLRATIARLHAAGGAFAEVGQVQAVVRLLEQEVLPAYRKFHSNLLFHQEDAFLERPFFVGKVCEAILAQGAPWEETERIVSGALQHLNDYVGYRPVATLASGDTTEPYAHEFIRPLPVYVRGAGVEMGRYEKILRLAIEILQQTNQDILDRAWFDWERLDEIAIDPRAYDFEHPVNRRPNYHFGQWDPRQISPAGYYHRFVLQQITLDALLTRCLSDNGSPGTDPEERWQEAATVLAGTMLMASGTTGDGPARHDSSVTLSSLLPHIAAYRDDFYTQLLEQATGNYGTALRAEAKRYRQPFGGARQHLNHELGRRRALQMQRVHMAHLFARLGFPQAAQQQAQAVRVASARMITEIYCHLTSGHDAIDAGNLEHVVAALTGCEKLLQDAIHCGALMDPWNVVGFGANFSLFPALENTVHDWRADELIELVEQVLDLAARAWSESAAADDAALESRFSDQLARLAEWWDTYATASVESVKHLVAKEIEISANLVAGALNAWHKAGAAAGDIAFWRMFVDQFDSSKAFQLVIEALLDQGDQVASMALMMQWVSQKERTPLEEGDNSFRRLAFRWLATVEQQQAETQENAWPLIVKFFAHLEANAEEYWQVPTMMFGTSADEMLDLPGEDDSADYLDGIQDTAYFEAEQQELGEDDAAEDESGELYQAAYEEMVYRDTTDDGYEGDIVDEGEDWEHTEWEYEISRLEQRLDFLACVASLWKHAAIAWGTARTPIEAKSASAAVPRVAHSEVLDQWLTQAAINYEQLVAMLEMVHGFELVPTSSAHDSVVEYDRLRSLKESLVQRIIGTSVETADAARLLAATHDTQERETSDLLQDPVNHCAVHILSAILVGDAAAVRAKWQDFLAALAPKSLLYIPHTRGGQPRQIVATRSLQKLLYDLLGWLPQIGMIRETCQLLEVAQRLEVKHPVGQGAVTEFDRLFENGYQAIVRSMVASAELWDESATQNHHADHLLVDALQQLTEQQLDRWLEHSHTLRLSAVEKVAENASWQRFVKFIERYGADLFDQKFMSFGNLRGILHQSVEQWLENLEQMPEAVDRIRLLEELDIKCPRPTAVASLTLAMEAVVENFRVYRDYNTTTTQSDHGELLYTLIDFLRLQAAYDRVAWNLKPVVWAHEILVRQERALAAEMWCQAFAERTAEAADAQQAKLEELDQKYGMHLATVADRIGERFIRPLLIDRVKALVEPALGGDEDVRQIAFAGLEREIASLANEPSGAGLDLPDWLAALEDEVTTARSRANHQPSADRLARRIGQVRLTWPELLEQLETSE